MKRSITSLPILAIYICILSVLILFAAIGERAITVISEKAPIVNRKCVIIDAGHGGVDGGATSCSGILESKINLEIAIKLNDLMHLFGIQTQMVRQTDISIYTQGNSIAQKKVSDLKQRVKIVNQAKNAILISIHQNYFSDSRYKGAQVFYSKTAGSDRLASKLQAELINCLDPNNHRKAKKADGVYLMENINCVGVLVECGFISNPEEDAKLRNPTYQNKLCSVIAATISQYLNNNNIA